MPIKNCSKKIIINADDLGLTEGINRAIIYGFRQGIITRASIMPCAAAFNHAVSMVKHNKGLSTGIHLTLVGEKPVSALDIISTLINPSGVFYKNHQIFMQKYFFGQIRLSEIYTELEAQIKKVISTGIEITHIDSHQHLHMLPGLFKITIDLAKRFKIKNVRIIKQNFFDIRSLKGLVLQSASSLYKKKLSGVNLGFTDNFWGLGKSGLINEADILNLFDKIKIGVTEIMCHPGYADEEYLSKYSHWGYDPDEELKALISENVKNKLKNNRIELVF